MTSEMFTTLLKPGKQLINRHMTYDIPCNLETSFGETIDHITKELQQEGFRALSQRLILEAKFKEN